jgi:hypothetical protein
MNSFGGYFAAKKRSRNEQRQADRLERVMNVKVEKATKQETRDSK